MQRVVLQRVPATRPRQRGGPRPPPQSGRGANGSLQLQDGNDDCRRGRAKADTAPNQEFLHGTDSIRPGSEPPLTGRRMFKQKNLRQNIRFRRRFSNVREGGFEPPRPFGHWHLKPARLPFRHSRIWSPPPFPFRVSVEQRDQAYRSLCRIPKRMIACGRVGVLDRMPTPVGGPRCGDFSLLEPFLEASSPGMVAISIWVADKVFPSHAQ